MDFIEQWFGISPDGGDGSLEVLWAVAIVAVAAGLFFRRRITTWLASRSQRQR
jgi:MYXO-CTERM domain-containing protein